jgi:hypothetical protein
MFQLWLGTGSNGRCRQRTGYVADGLTNLVRSTGADWDEAPASSNVMPILDFQFLLNAYRGTWPRKIVAIPPLDIYRNRQADKAKPSISRLQRNAWSYEARCGRASQPAGKRRIES